MKKFGWRRCGVLLTVISVIVLILIVKRTEDTAVFHRFLARQAEETAVDCGIIPIGGNSEEGFNCALAAQEAGKGFILQIQRQSIDSQIADGWAATQNGNLLFLHYDSDPSGGNRTSAVIYQQTCATPEWDAQKINCDYFESPIYIRLSLLDTMR